MSKIILIVEDKKSEQVIAKKAILDSGNKIIIADTLEKAESLIDKFDGKLSGIITDIHFPITAGMENFSGANGISVVITALKHSIPCAVCTDDLAHGTKYVALIIKRLEMLKNRTIPVSGTKDWNYVLQTLLTIM